MAEPPSRAQAARTVAGASTAAIGAGMPIFLLATLAVLIREEFPFDELQLGLAVGVYFAVGAVASLPAGSLGDRLGARKALVLGSLAGVLTMVTVGVAATTWTMIVMGAFVAGLANAMVQPATNLAIASAIPFERQGIAFGLKQASMPVGTLIAGVAVPVLALTLGWRWTFVLVALLGLAVLILPRIDAGAPGRRASERHPDVRTARGPLVMMVSAGVGAGGTAACLMSFAMTSLIARGASPAAASGVYVAASVASIATRIIVGIGADRRDGRHLLAIAGLIAGGAVGYALMALDASMAVAAAGTVLAFGGGWGWAGLFNYAIVAYYPRYPGRISGLIQVGILVGGMVGPLLFGTTVVRVSYSAAWAGSAVVAMLTVVVLLSMRPMLARDLARRGWSRTAEVVTAQRPA